MNTSVKAAWFGRARILECRLFKQFMMSLGKRRSREEVRTSRAVLHRWRILDVLRELERKCDRISDCPDKVLVFRDATVRTATTELLTGGHNSRRIKSNSLMPRSLVYADGDLLVRRAITSALGGRTEVNSKTYGVSGSLGKPQQREKSANIHTHG